MKKVLLVVFSLIGLLAGSAQASDSINCLFGEFINARGGGGSWVHNTQHIKSVPFALFDGSVIEYLLLYHITKSDNLTVSIGPPLGALNNSDGAEFYGGIEFRTSFRFWAVKPSFRYAHRTAEHNRLHNICNVGLITASAPIAYGVYYQPIQRCDPEWEHRVAGRIKLSTSRFYFSLEGRYSLDREVVTTNFEVEIPFTL